MEGLSYCQIFIELILLPIDFLFKLLNLRILTFVILDELVTLFSYILDPLPVTCLQSLTVLKVHKTLIVF